MSEVGDRLDDLAVVIATTRSRRAVLRAGAAVFGAAFLAPVLGGRALGASNDCARFCQSLPPGRLRGKCVEDAAHGRGLCFACGPKGSNAGLCGMTCCPTGTSCVNGQCQTSGGGGGYKCPCDIGPNERDCICVVCGEQSGLPGSGFLCSGPALDTLCCTDPVTGQSACVHPLSDQYNCGGCGVQCGGGQVCANGICACPPDHPVACTECCLPDYTCATCPNLELRCCWNGTPQCVVGPGGVGTWCCPTGYLAQACPGGMTTCCPPGFTCTDASGTCTAA